MSFVIRDLPKQVDPRIIEKLSRAETATIGHVRQQGFADRRIQCVLPGRRVAGTAVTLAIPGQDSALLHHVVGLLRPRHLWTREDPRAKEAARSFGRPSACRS